LVIFNFQFIIFNFQMAFGTIDYESFIVAITF